MSRRIFRYKADVPASLTPDSSYSELVIDLQKMIAESQAKARVLLNTLRTETYWQMGKRIHEVFVATDVRARSGFMKRLALDLGVDKSLMSRIYSFYQRWPLGLTVEAKALGWSQHAELLGLSDAKKQQFYLQEAVQEGWNSKVLRRAIKGDYYASRKNGRRGGILKRSKTALHVYKAELVKVVDGDTMLVNVDLGFDVWVKSRIRFRGIDASQLDKGSGEQAKAFIEDKLKGIPFMVLRTFKTDMYGRYVADVMYHPTLSQKEAVFKKGFYLNAELVQAGLAQVTL